LLKRLRRITRDGQWIPEIDGLRFVAIISVVLFHLAVELSARSGRIIPIEARYWWLERLLLAGDRGVGVFFVISGMILAMPFARCYLLGSKPVSIRKYFVRRVTRLEPPYIASMFLAVVMVAIYQHGLSRGYWVHVLMSALYQHNLVYGEMSTVNPVSWSLEVEIQFYIIAPIIMLLFRIRQKGSRRTVLLALVLALGAAQLPFQKSLRFDMSIAFYFQYFLAGLVVADIFVIDLKNMHSHWLWDVAGVSALCAIFLSPKAAYWPHVVMPLETIILCIAAMRSFAIRRCLANQVVAVVGGMCYSIYLMHFLFIAVIFKISRYAILTGVDFPVNYLLQIVVTGIPALILSAAFFVLIERPCMEPNWPSKLWGAIRAPSRARALAAG
jgi:peptidoglycan/LPS O-acetylase OafA/YrhL